MLDRIFETKRILYIFQGEIKCFYLHGSCKSDTVFQGVLVGYSVRAVEGKPDAALLASVRSDRCTQSRGAGAASLHHLTGEGVASSSSALAFPKRGNQVLVEYKTEQPLLQLISALGNVLCLEPNPCEELGRRPAPCRDMVP